MLNILKLRGRSSLTLALLAFAQLIIALDYTIVFVAIPDIGARLDFPAHALQWVASGYAVAFGGFLLLGGRMADLLGRRRMFVAGLLLYGVSSLIGGFADSPAILIAARALQGLGGAMLAPATLSLISTTFAEGRERNRAFAVWGAAGGSGMALGSLLGGVLTQAFGWESVFLVNVPLAALGIGFAFILIPSSRQRTAHRAFDLPGAITATAGITLIVFALVQGSESGWSTPLVAGAAVIGAALLLAFVRIESRSADPLVPAWLLSRDLRIGVLITFMFAATFGPLLYFKTIYFQTVHGFTALQTGLAFLVPTVAILVGANVGGRAANRFGLHATLATSLGVGAVGTGMFGLALSSHTSYAALVPALLILGFGQGSAFTTMYAAATHGVAGRAQGVASGMASTGQQVGVAVGLALLVAMTNGRTADLAGPALIEATVQSSRTAILTATAGIVVAAVVAVIPIYMRRRTVLVSAIPETVAR